MAENIAHTVVLNKNVEQIEVGDCLAELMKTLESIDEADKLAKLNEATISDNNGGRIQL